MGWHDAIFVLSQTFAPGSKGRARVVDGKAFRANAPPGPFDFAQGRLPGGRPHADFAEEFFGAVEKVVFFRLGSEGLGGLRRCNICC
jgi:hypothetical protein